MKEDFKGEEGIKAKGKEAGPKKVGAGRSELGAGNVPDNKSA